LRGGGWSDFARFCRSARRIRFGSGDRNSFFGFRLACSAGPREDSEVNDVVEPQKTEQDDIKRVQLWEGGPYWADRNIGADKPEAPGYYFWWGDTVGYKREGDKWVASDGSNSNFEFGKLNAYKPETLADVIKICRSNSNFEFRNEIRDSNIPTCGKSVSDLRSEGWITADGVLSPQHDAAQKHWGGNWRMPTDKEFKDLVSKCDWSWTQVNGVNGYLVRGKGEYSSKSIFLPCAGGGVLTSLCAAGSVGDYWTSVPSSDDNKSWNLNFYSGNRRTLSIDRYDGQSVRPLQGFTK
jgi:hypothetical protein